MGATARQGLQDAQKNYGILMERFFSFLVQTSAKRSLKRLTFSFKHNEIQHYLSKLYSSLLFILQLLSIRGHQQPNKGAEQCCCQVCRGGRPGPTQQNR